MLHMTIKSAADASGFSRWQINRAIRSGLIKKHWVYRNPASGYRRIKREHFDDVVQVMRWRYRRSSVRSGPALRLEELPKDRLSPEALSMIWNELHRLAEGSVIGEVDHKTMSAVHLACALDHASCTFGESDCDEIRRAAWRAESALFEGDDDPKSLECLDRARRALGDPVPDTQDPPPAQPSAED